MTDIADLSLAALAKAIARGQVSSLEATQSCLKGLATLGRELNAVAGLDAEQALKDARRADRARARRKGRGLGPLHGVPLAHKDMFYRKGRLSECGAKIRKGYVPAVTATVLEKLDAAGALDIARLNMVEFAMGPTGHNEHTGCPRNPWNPAHVPGGSSSGPAVAVAARLCCGALGSDTGGSIRMPAAFCGLVGVKPTYGRVSRHGAMPLSFSQDHVGALTRTVEDAALMLQAIAGHDPKDGASAREPVPNYRAGLEKGAKGLRVAVEHGWFRDGIHPEVAGCLDGAAATFGKLGARVADIRIPSLESLNQLAMLVTGVEAASYHARWLAERPEDYGAQIRLRLEQGLLHAGTRYVDALRLRAQKLDWFLDTFLAQADVLLLPILPFPVPTIAETDVRGDARAIDLVVRVARNSRPVNYFGLPAVVVPCGFTGNGLPVGMQLVGRPFAEALLLRAARAYERETGCTQRQPPHCHKAD